MVQYRRLDPLANAGPFQRLQKSPVKSFSLTEKQYETVKERRPELLVTHGESAVIGVPHRDYLEIHYAYPDVEAFRDNFVAMTQQVLNSSTKEEAPRGAILSFRDSPNRALAEMLFWPLLMNEGGEWVEMTLVAVPEQPEPSSSLEGGYSVREITDADRDAVRRIEAEVTGRAPLTEGGLTSMLEYARWSRVVTDATGAAVGFVLLDREPGGWGVIRDVVVLPAHQDALRGPLLEWSIAFLRNNGGRRIRRQLAISAGPDLALLREKGFTAGDTGLDYFRSVDAEEIRALESERRAHGTLIKFGDWR